MEKNHIAYYRVAENLLNFSSKSQELYSIINVIFAAEKLEMVSPNEISLERLLQFNIGQKLQIQNLEDELHRDQEE
jgi:hypothetical protein